MTPHELAILRRLLALAQGRMTKQGHPAILASQEFLGICNARHWRSGCGPTCLAANQTLKDAEALVAEYEAAVPVQMELIA